MTHIIPQRVTAQIDDEVIVFLIGMRINNYWKFKQWLPVAQAMPRMIKELYANPSSGFLGAESWFGNPTLMVQYWRSFEDLERYARNQDQVHFPSWKAFNQSMRGSSHVGIWHETYRIQPGAYETVYNNMPLFGLAKATRMVPAEGLRKTAAGRLGVNV